MNMNNEPIRLPALVALVVVLACAIAVSLLLHLEPKEAVSLVLGVLAVFAPALAVTESKRARTDSPATIEAKWQAHASAVASDLADRTGTPVEVTVPDIDLSTPAEGDAGAGDELDPADLKRRVEYLEGAVNVLVRNAS